MLKMNIETATISPEKPEEFDAVEALAAEAFGPGRFARTAFRLRENVPHEVDLSFILKDKGQLAGSVRLTKIMIGEDQALLLGPLVVAPVYKNSGVGRKLMEVSVNTARDKGHGGILLVGDLPYYQQFGFEVVKHGAILMPGPVNAQRLLICKLQGDEGKSFSGQARSATFPEPHASKASE